MNQLNKLLLHVSYYNITTVHWALLNERDKMTRFKKSLSIALALSPVFGLLAAVFFAMVKIAVVSGLLMIPTDMMREVQ